MSKLLALSSVIFFHKLTVPSHLGRYNCSDHSTKGTEGIITSPNFPGHYPVNARCIWNIEAPPEYTQIRLKFHKFSVENPKWARICFKDFVHVYQYDGGKRETRGKYCGKNTGKVVTASGNRIQIVFSSDSFRTRKGFKISWKALKGKCEY